MKYYSLPALNPRFISREKYFFLFETALYDCRNFKSYIFCAPVDIIKIHRLSETRRAFEKIDVYARRYFLAGYFSYELGYSFERSSFKSPEAFSYPLMHLAVFDRIIVFNHQTGRLSGKIPGLFSPARKTEPCVISNLKYNYTQRQYAEKIAKIKNYIRRGDTYQVNFTGKFTFDFYGSRLALYQELKNSQHVAYAAFCKCADESIISLSPELFFRRQGARMYSQPMKGTIRRGRDIAGDREKVAELRESPKIKAENLMIVDLIRNDLGRICVKGSVNTEHLFQVQKYDTLFQMISTVSGALRPGSSYYDIFRNIFPGGSVTGAPKIRTMQIIRELERSRRNIYCGALGIIFPSKASVFNMPIRTISIRKNKGEMGAGSGIVIDSDAGEEFRECLLKADFLTHRHEDFRLLETMLWDNGFVFLRQHIGRMKASARYFAFSFDERKAKAFLKKTEKTFRPGRQYRVRILADQRGKMRIGYTQIAPVALGGRHYVAISEYRISPENVFFYHKTTNRALYDSEYKKYAQKGYFDVLFLNQRGEVSEGAISNVVIEKKGRLYTPPVSSGLLPGIFREHLLRGKKVKERIISLGELRKADRIFCCNSVRGLVGVILEKE